MNEINAAKKARRELAEADKIKIVTAAEAEVEKKTACTGSVLLSNGRPLSTLADSIVVSGDTRFWTEEQIMSCLANQSVLLDTLNNFADKEGNNDFPTS